MRPFIFQKRKRNDLIPSEKLISPAYVAERMGDLSVPDAKSILQRAAQSGADAEKKIPIKGNTTMTHEAAEVFTKAHPNLIGNESQTVGPENAPMAVHLILLQEEIVLLKDIRF